MHYMLMAWVGTVALIACVRLYMKGEEPKRRVTRHWSVVAFNVLETQVGAVLLVLFISSPLGRAVGVGLLWLTALVQLNTLRPQLKRLDTGKRECRRCKNCLSCSLLSCRQTYEQLYHRLDVLKIIIGLFALALPT